MQGIGSFNMEKNWWEEKFGFFGKHYMMGDNSLVGYHEDRSMTLQQRTEEEARGVLNICKLKTGDFLLDCPCGYGRHSIWLAKKGLRVVGADINSFELKIAKKIAKRKGVRVSFIKKNMLKLKCKNKFDALINMWYSFGFFDKDEDNLKVLKNFYEALKPEGIFLMHTDVNIPRVLNGKFREYEKRPLVGGGFLRQIEFYNPETKRNHGVWVVEKGKSIESKEYSVRVYSKEEFIRLCKLVGFKKVEVYSDWNGKKYDPNSEDMIIVATK